MGALLLGLAPASQAGASPRSTAQRPKAALPSAASAPTAQDALRLSVTGADASAADASQGRYAFGNLGPLETAPVQHTFLLRNDSPTPLTLTEARPSCGCASALVGEDGRGALPLVLPPGRRARVRVTIDPARAAPGALDKYVWVFVRKQAAPAATLEMVGRLLPAASFSPALLDFGRVPAGNGPSRELSVTMDRRLLPAGVTPRLTCSNPDIAISPVSAHPGADDGAAAYRLTLSPQAQLGPLNAQVCLTLAAADAGKGSRTVDGGSVSLVGEVVGDVAAAPAAVAFGTVSQGKAAMQQVILTGQDLDGLKIACGNAA